MERAFRRSFSIAAMLHGAGALLALVLASRTPLRPLEASPRARSQDAAQDVIELDLASLIERPIAYEPKVAPTPEASILPPATAPASIGQRHTHLAVATTKDPHPKSEPVKVSVDGTASAVAPPIVATAGGVGASGATQPPGKSGLGGLAGKGTKWNGLGRPDWMPSIMDDDVRGVVDDARSDDEKTAARVQNELVAMVDATTPAGQGFGGPVVNAAHDVAMGTVAPDAGLAVLQVLTDSSGAVTSVRVLSASGDLPGWNSVASAIATSMKGKKLQLPSASSGAQVTVQITAKVELPSGSDPDHPIQPFVTLGGVGAVFDLSDIGAKPMRVVSVHELSEARL